jgi:phenylpropionate dioxygenase-like ring-hydroxylating dioxygenase large terminal subunit
MNSATRSPARLDNVVLDAWYPILAVDEMPHGSRRETTLLDTTLLIERKDAGTFWVSAQDSHEARSGGPALPVLERYGYLWTTLGRPADPLFSIPEYVEPDRRNMNGATLAVRVSAPRVVENFLDLGHFAMVHTGYLGIEPHTEIKPYKVSVRPHEILATECIVFQPLAALSAKSGQDVEYTYRVPHPYCAVLYKSCAVDASRRDVIGIFVQPVTEVSCIAHMFLSMLDIDNSDADMKAWQQVIFGQDKPILENQIPARLPLSPTAEISIRADATSAAYRRWLFDNKVRYGTLFPESANG